MTKTELILAKLNGTKKAAFLRKAGSNPNIKAADNVREVPVEKKASLEKLAISIGLPARAAAKAKLLNQPQRAQKFMDYAIYDANSAHSTPLNRSMFDPKEYNLSEANKMLGRPSDFDNLAPSTQYRKYNTPDGESYDVVKGLERSYGGDFAPQKTKAVKVNGNSTEVGYSELPQTKALIKRNPNLGERLTMAAEDHRALVPQSGKTTIENKYKALELEANTYRELGANSNDLSRVAYGAENRRLMMGSEEIAKTRDSRINESFKSWEDRKTKLKAGLDIPKPTLAEKAPLEELTVTAPQYDNSLLGRIKQRLNKSKDTSSASNRLNEIKKRNEGISSANTQVDTENTRVLRQHELATKGAKRTYDEFISEYDNKLDEYDNLTSGRFVSNNVRDLWKTIGSDAATKNIRPGSQATDLISARRKKLLE